MEREKGKEWRYNYPDNYSNLKQEAAHPRLARPEGTSNVASHFARILVTLRRGTARCGARQSYFKRRIIRYNRKLTVCSETSL